jgi:hypothetical protein
MVREKTVLTLYTALIFCSSQFTVYFESYTRCYRKVALLSPGLKKQ